jgi:hypothetical protein
VIPGHEVAGVIGDPGEVAVPGERVAVADPAGLHPDAYLASPGLGDFTLDELERATPLGDLHRTHLGHQTILLVGISARLSAGTQSGGSS